MVSLPAQICLDQEIGEVRASSAGKPAGESPQYKGGEPFGWNARNVIGHRVMLPQGRVRGWSRVASDHRINSFGSKADMSTMIAEKVETLDVCFGTYPHTQRLKNGDIKSDPLALRFNEVQSHQQGVS